MTQATQPPIEAQIGGLKCDTATCDYRDDQITVDQYESYVNAPCPKCGASLLTPEDFAVVQHTLLVTEFINSLSSEELSELINIPIEDLDTTETGTLSMELNGTGDVQMTLSKNDPKEGESA